MSAERFKPDDSPIAYDAYGSKPIGERFFSTYSEYDRKSYYHTTYAPVAFSENFQSFLIDFLEDNELPPISEEERSQFLRYISSNIGIEQISTSEHTSPKDVRTNIHSVIKRMHSELPKEERSKYKIRELLKPKKGGNKFSSATSDSSNGGFGSQSIEIAAKLKEEFGRIIKERQNAADRKKQKLDSILERVRDLSEEERDENPDIGAIYNTLLANHELEPRLIQFFIRNPNIMVRNRRMQQVQSRLWGRPYITFAQGVFLYINHDRRYPLTPEYILRLYSPDEDIYDHEVVERFGKQTFAQLKEDVIATAIEASYSPTGFSLEAT